MVIVCWLVGDLMYSFWSTLESVMNVIPLLLL